MLNYQADLSSVDHWSVQTPVQKETDSRTAERPDQDRLHWKSCKLIGACRRFGQHGNWRNSCGCAELTEAVEALRTALALVEDVKAEQIHWAGTQGNLALAQRRLGDVTDDLVCPTPRDKAVGPARHWTTKRTLHSLGRFSNGISPTSPSRGIGWTQTLPF